MKAELIITKEAIIKLLARVHILLVVILSRVQERGLQSIRNI